jgi:CHAP domain
MAEPGHVAWARYLQSQNTHMIYSEGSARMSAIGQWPLKFPITADCSAFVTLVFWLAGMPDPNGLNYDHEGYTGTLLSHGHKVDPKQVQVGDVVVYGPGTGWHTALVTEVTKDGIRTISHGQQGDPNYCWVNGPNNPHDGRLPQTFLRFNTNVTGVARPIPVGGSLPTLPGSVVKP